MELELCLFYQRTFRGFGVMDCCLDGYLHFRFLEYPKVKNSFEGVKPCSNHVGDQKQIIGLLFYITTVYDVHDCTMTT